jgi:hypothetical protein
MKKNAETARRKTTPGSASPTQFSTLEKGQVWKMGENFVQITDTGKRLVYYKLAKALKKAGLRSHLASIQSVQAFLKSNQAELMVKA